MSLREGILDDDIRIRFLQRVSAPAQAVPEPGDRSSDFPVIFPFGFIGMSPQKPQFSVDRKGAESIRIHHLIETDGEGILGFGHVLLSLAHRGHKGPGARARQGGPGADR